MAQIELDAEAVKALVGEGIMAQLTDEKREAIIRQAVENLFVEPEDTRGYGYRQQKLPSAFMEAFRNAAAAACRDILHEEARNPESPLRKAVHGKVAEILAAMNEDGGYMSDLQRQIGRSIGEIIANGWSQRQYEGD